MEHRLSIRPITWGIASVQPTDKSYLKPGYHLYGVTRNNQTVYLRIDSEVTTLQQFWKQCELKPYETLVVNDYAPLPGRYAQAELNLVCSSSDLKSENIRIDVSKTLMFWDIETRISIPGRFTDANDPGDEIFMISLLVVVDDEITEIIITTLASCYQPGVIVITAPSEKDLLREFLTLWSRYRPDHSIYYNGDIYDLPYVHDRALRYHLTIPSLGKIQSYPSEIDTYSYTVPVGINERVRWRIFGTEFIDLLSYLRRRYPFLPNHRLSTVSTWLLSDGKDDMHIDDIMAVAETGTSHQEHTIKDVIHYSLMDVRCLYEIWREDRVDDYLTMLANNLLLTREDILRQPYWQLLNMDSPVTDYLEQSHVQQPTSGRYTDVVVRDYSELYRHVLLQSQDERLVSLARRLEGAWPQLKLLAYTLGQQELSSLLHDKLAILTEDVNIVAVGPTTIWHVGEWNNGKYPMVEEYPIFCFIPGNEAPLPCELWNYLALTHDGQLLSAGYTPVTQPCCKLVTQHIISFFTEEEVVPCLQDYILTARMRPFQEYAPYTPQCKLSGSATVTEYRTYAYIQTTHGPILYRNFSHTDTVNKNYYDNKIEEARNLLLRYVSF
jgi:hypothetical protein